MKLQTIGRAIVWMVVVGSSISLVLAIVNKNPSAMLGWLCALTGHVNILRLLDTR